MYIYGQGYSTTYVQLIELPMPTYHLSKNLQNYGGLLLNYSSASPSVQTIIPDFVQGDGFSQFVEVVHMFISF